jgi:hypothetical protein
MMKIVYRNSVDLDEILYELMLNVEQSFLYVLMIHQDVIQLNELDHHEHN